MGICLLLLEWNDHFGCSPLLFFLWFFETQVPSCKRPPSARCPLIPSNSLKLVPVFFFLPPKIGSHAVFIGVFRVLPRSPPVLVLISTAVQTALRRVPLSDDSLHRPSLFFGSLSHNIIHSFFFPHLPLPTVCPCLADRPPPYPHRLARCHVRLSTLVAAHLHFPFIDPRWSPPPKGVSLALTTSASLNTFLLDQSSFYNDWPSPPSGSFLPRHFFLSSETYQCSPTQALHTIRSPVCVLFLHRVIQ